MRRTRLIAFVLATVFGHTAHAQPAASSSVPAASASTSAAPPPPPEASSAPAGGYQPTPPSEPATTRLQPPDVREWRLVDPAETDWRTLDPNRPRGWFRVDTDGRGMGGYVGGSFRIDDGLAFAPFAHASATVVEPNLALTWQTGALWVMPAIGTSLDFGTTRAASIDPQLFVAVDMKLIYLEAWAQYFVASVYHSGATDSFAARLIALVSLGSAVGIGGEWDPTLVFPSSSTVASSIVGGRTNLRIGDHDTVGLFVGYQTVSQARIASEGVAGRLEYVHQW